ncbi:MAG: tetratricopeptide repeat protein [Burkholderiales bacterium]
MLGDAFRRLSRRAARAELPPDEVFAQAARLLEAGDFGGAARHATRLIEREPENPYARIVLARAHARSGDVDEARAVLNRAIDARSSPVLVWAERAELERNAGRVAEGWAEYESRLAGPGFTRGVGGLPRWGGADPSGMRLRVIAVQGLGDSIMFARFITLLTERRARVQFPCRRNMVRLFQASFDPAEVEVTADPEADTTGIDAHVHLMSLPHLLQLPREALLAKEPHLRIPVDLEMAWQARVAAALGRSPAALKVGFMWADNPDRSRDEDRSLPIELARRLGEAGDGIAWFSLQVDTERSRNTGGPFPMIDLTSEMSDYADSMGLIAAMYLVISVDTSTAHATAAMGQALWLVAPHNVCWRWVIAGTENPWCSGVRIPRAVRPRECAPVVERVATELAGLAARKVV